MVDSFVLHPIFGDLIGKDGAGMRKETAASMGRESMHQVCMKDELTRTGRPRF